MKKILRHVIRIVAIPLLQLFSKILQVDKIHRSYLHLDSSTIPMDVQYCLILGAKLFEDDSITPMLANRLDTAIKLFQERPHIKLILSGDGSKRFSNDVQAMYVYLKQHCEISDDQIILDSQGYTSLDSIQHITPEIDANGFILLTSAFHMPRCVYICHRLGLHPYALQVSSSYSPLSSRHRDRELLSMVKTWYVLTFGQPLKQGIFHRFLFHCSFFTGKLTNIFLHFLGHSQSPMSGRIALYICPTFLSNVTGSLSLYFIVGTDEKEKTYQRLEQYLRTQQYSVLPGVSRECSPADVTTILLTNSRKLCSKKKNTHAIFNCREIDFYKIMQHINSCDVNFFVTGLTSPATTSISSCDRIRNQILTGIDQCPHATVYLNTNCPASVALQEELSNPIRFYTREEFFC